MVLRLWQNLQLQPIQDISRLELHSPDPRLRPQIHGPEPDRGRLLYRAAHRRQQVLRLLRDGRHDAVDLYEREVQHPLRAPGQRRAVLHLPLKRMPPRRARRQLRRVQQHPAVRPHQRHHPEQHPDAGAAHNLDGLVHLVHGDVYHCGAYCSPRRIQSVGGCYSGHCYWRRGRFPPHGWHVVVLPAEEAGQG